MAAVGLALLASACSGGGAEPPETTARASTIVVSPVGEPAPREAVPVRTPVIIDTDLGPDDLFATLLLLQQEHLDVQAITLAGTGRARCEPGLRNLAALLELASAGGIPIACGRETPLSGTREFPPEWRDAADDLYGIGLDRNGAAGDRPSAVEVLQTVLTGAEAPVMVVALGPLTNLAELVNISPELVGNLGLVYAGGGAPHLPAGGSQADLLAEWNFFVDPEAARTVVDAGLSLTILTTEAAADLFAGFDAAGLLAAVDEPLAKVSRALSASSPLDQLAPADVVVAALASDEALGVYEMAHVGVAESAGPASPTIVPDPAGARVRIVSSVAAGGFERLLLSTLGEVEAPEADVPEAPVESLGEVVWQFEFEGPFDRNSLFSHWSASLADGVVYAGGTDGRVYAFEAETGRKVWSITVVDGVGINGPMALWGDLVVFRVPPGPDSGFEEGLLAVDRADGTERWRFSPSGEEIMTRHPAVWGDAVLTGSNEALYALDAATGDELWRLPIEGGAPDPAASVAVVDGVAYFGNPTARLFALDLETREVLWQFQTGASRIGVASRPAVSDGVVYFGSDDAVFYAVDQASGEEVWRYQAPGPLPSSPAVVDGRVFVGAVGPGDGNLISLDAGTGEELWRASRGGIVSSPVVADGTVYVGAGDGNMYAVDGATGTVAWRFRTDTEIGSSPLVADGVVFFSSGPSFFAVKAPS